METICVEVPDKMGETVIVHTGKYMVIAPKSMIFHPYDTACTKLHVVTEEELHTIQQLEEKLRDCIQLIADKDKQIENLREKDYKNRALKSSLTRTKNVIKLLTNN